MVWSRTTSEATLQFPQTNVMEPLETVTTTPEMTSRPSLSASVYQSDNFAQLMDVGRYHHNTDFRVLTPQEFAPWFRQVVIDGLLYTEASFGSSVEQIGLAPAGFQTFALLDTVSTDLRYEGETIGNLDLMCIPNNASFQTVCNPGCHGHLFSIEQQFLEKIALERFPIDWEALMMTFKGGYFVSISAQTAEILLSSLRDLSTYASMPLSADVEERSHTMAVIGSIKENLAEQIIAALLNSSLKTRRKMPAHRDRCLKAALNYVEEQTPRLLSTRDFTDIVLGSMRTLEYAFNQYYGMSPKKYLRARQLNFVMRDLTRKSSSDTTVTEVANYWGLSHMGQFAKDYSALFGERPKDTLRNYN